VDLFRHLGANQGDNGAADVQRSHLELPGYLYRAGREGRRPGRSRRQELGTNGAEASGSSGSCARLIIRSVQRRSYGDRIASAGMDLDGRALVTKSKDTAMLHPCTISVRRPNRTSRFSGRTTCQRHSAYCVKVAATRPTFSMRTTIGAPVRGGTTTERLPCLGHASGTRRLQSSAPASISAKALLYASMAARRNIRRASRRPRRSRSGRLPRYDDVMDTNSNKMEWLARTYVHG